MTDADPAPGQSAVGAPDGPPAAAAGAGTDADGRVAALRGAGVDVDVRRLGRVIVVVGLVVLAAATVVLFVAGARKNAQQSALHHQGVPVTVRVIGCSGLLGGSGSNAAGYSCRGSFVVNGQRHVDEIPGAALHQPGTTIRAVTVPSDPGLLATAGEARTDRASWGVFVVPTVLLVVLGLAVGALLVRTRRARHRAPQD